MRASGAFLPYAGIKAPEAMDVEREGRLFNG